MTKNTTLSLILTLAAAVSFANPAITLDRAQQRYPWNGLVDIDYTISGLTGNASDYVVTLEWSSASAGENGTTHAFVELASCDLPTGNGAHRVTWNAGVDGLDFLAKDFTLEAKLTYAPITECEADYMIIDLAAGKDAAEYPIRLAQTGTNYSTANFNSAPYKQSKLVLKKVKAGEFWMGENNVASGTGTTRHRVRLARDYWLAVFETTQGQVRRVTGVVKSDYQTDATGELAPERPENRVSYDVTMHPTAGMIGRLNLRAKVGSTLAGGFNLPTEAEWEHACRAGTETKYNWDSDTTDALGDYAWSSGNASSMTHPVGGKLPNNWGFYDMHGNVSEWCRDWAYVYPLYSPTHVSTNPVGSVWTRMKVLRGGSYHPNFGALTSGGRECTQTVPNQTTGGYTPYYASQFGFRVFKEMAGGDALGADPVVQSTATLANLKVDFNPATIRVLATIADLLPIAWNDDALWAQGGSGNGAEVTVTAASSDTPENVATWTDAETETLVSSTGEGVTNWAPTAASLYRLDLRQGGQTVASGYYNLKGCPELESKISIDSFTANLSQSEFPCTGYPHEPTVTLVDGNNNELEPNIDYVVSYSENINAGTAIVTVSGAGDYEGVITKTFTIVRVPPADKAGGSFGGTARIDTRPPDEEALRVSTWLHLLPLEWNDTAKWTRGGDTNELNAVKVTCVAINAAGETVPGAEPVTLVDYANGEGLVGWSSMRGGRYRVVSELYSRSHPAANWVLGSTNATRVITVVTEPGFQFILQ